MKIKATIEKGNDGYYSVRSDAKIGRAYLGGFGNTVEEARADFAASIEEAIDDAKDNGLKYPLSIAVEFTYDLPSFFNYFDIINVSKFADYAGINESKMRQYKSGVTCPGEKTTKKILSAIKKIGAEFSMVSL
jgi:predicted RNase H-like HicB family nuclease